MKLGWIPIAWNLLRGGTIPREAAVREAADDMSDAFSSFKEAEARHSAEQKVFFEQLAKDLANLRRKH